MINIELLTKHPELAENITFSMKGNDLILFAHELADRMTRNTSQPVATVTPSEPDILLTVDEAAEFLKVSRVTLWQWEKKKILIPSKIGNMLRYRKSDITIALDRRSSK
ncbi:MAG TPA: helix-turn-helix domain-containing protein [Draconibacterium sp.]|nr:helix-turn-helix domain-containing protein [Draconibacterium sp.]